LGKAWHQVGWMGVDLFFVLSGFLVSGLLFREFQQHGRVRIGRFLVRRGFKIYPGYYALLLVGIALRSSQLSQSKAALICDGLFLQNYLYYPPGTLWAHCWSLAVEEHFYIGLALVVFLLVRCRRKDPFVLLVPLFVLMALTCLALRVQIAARSYFARPPILYFPYTTHLRIDGLLFGSFLSYLYHFRPGTLVPVFQHRRWVLVLSMALLAPAYFLTAHSFFIVTLGLTMIYLGFGGLLLYCLGEAQASAWGEWLYRPLRGIGRYSYSIYLWHLLFVLYPQSFRWARCLGGPAMEVVCYFSNSFLVGIVLGRLIELPFLRLRDRLLPSLGDPPPMKGPAPAAAISLGRSAA
jgi:peptidoglycan/LPS O-acetylase OafA/YrhL